MIKYNIICKKCENVIAERTTYVMGVQVPIRNIVSVGGKEYCLCDSCIKELHKLITGEEPAVGVNKVVDDMVSKLGDMAGHISDVVNGDKPEPNGEPVTKKRDKAAEAIQKAADSGYLGQVIADGMVRGLNMGCDSVDALVDKIRRKKQ